MVREWHKGIRPGIMLIGNLWIKSTNQEELISGYLNPARRSPVKVVCNVQQLYLSFCELLILLDSKLRLPVAEPLPKPRDLSWARFQKYKARCRQYRGNILPGVPIESTDLETLEMPLTRSLKTGKGLNLMEPCSFICKMINLWIVKSVDYAQHTTRLAVKGFLNLNLK